MASAAMSADTAAARRPPPRRRRSPASEEGKGPRDVRREDPCSAFLRACQTNHREAVEDMAACVPRSTLEKGFYIACNSNRCSVVTALLTLHGEQRIDVAAYGNRAAQIACYNGHLTLLQQFLLLAPGAIDIHARVADPFPPLEGDSIGPDAATTDRTTTLLGIAARAGHMDVVEFLLQVGGECSFTEDEIREAKLCNDNNIRLTHCRIGKCLTSALREVQRKTGSETPEPPARHEFCTAAFYNACRRGDLVAIQAMLRLRADGGIDDIGATLWNGFRRACRFNHVKIVKYFLQLSGKDAIDIHAHNEDAFIAAASNGAADVVSLLLDRPDRIDIHAQGNRAMFQACYRGHLDVVLLLLEYRNEKGETFDVHTRMIFPTQRPTSVPHLTILAIAARFKHFKLVKYLLSLMGEKAFSIEEMQTAFVCTDSDSIAFLLQGAIGRRSAEEEREEEKESTPRPAGLPRAARAVRCLPAATGAGNDDDEITRRVSGLEFVKAQSAFYIACAHDDHAIRVRRMLRISGPRQVCIEYENGRAFRAACANGRVCTVNHLLTAGAEGRTAQSLNRGFKAACARGHVRVVKRIMQLKELSMETLQTGFSLACSAGHDGVVRLFLDFLPVCWQGTRINVHANDEEALCAACRNGHAAVVTTLLTQGGDQAPNLNARRGEPMRAAARYGHEAIVTLLLDRKECIMTPFLRLVCEDGAVEQASLRASIEAELTARSRARALTHTLAKEAMVEEEARRSKKAPRLQNKLAVIDAITSVMSRIMPMIFGDEDKFTANFAMALREFVCEEERSGPGAVIDLREYLRRYGVLDQIKEWVVASPSSGAALLNGFDFARLLACLKATRQEQ